MAQQITACIYGQNGNDWASIYGSYHGFPTAAVVFIPLNPSVTMSNIYMHSKIKVLNTADIFLFAPEFYTDRTVDSLITESNL